MSATPSYVHLGVWPQMPYQPKNAHPIYQSTSEQHQQPQHQPQQHQQQQQPQQRQNAPQAYKAQYEAHWQRPPQPYEIIAASVANNLKKELRPLAIAVGQRDHIMDEMLRQIMEYMRCKPNDSSSRMAATKAEADDISQTGENGSQDLKTTLEQLKGFMNKLPQLNGQLQEFSFEMAQYRKMMKKEGLKKDIPQPRRSERLLSKKNKGSIRSRGKKLL